VPDSARFLAAAEAIRAGQFDVLYYWEIGTDNLNYFLPFCRLAPLQCTSWGVPATSGIPQVDEYLSSELIEPAGAPAHYTEQLVLLPTLMSYQRRAAPSTASPGKEHFGIATDAHVYLCAQQLRKFHPEFDAILAGILRADPRGLIVAVEDHRSRYVAEQLRARFARTMPDVQGRVVFLPFQTYENYLHLIAAADVLLDPLHYGGVTTTYDGFSLDKPIVTLPAPYQRGRYVLGCYRQMGLDDCVVDSPEAYVKRCVALANDGAFHAHVTSKIAQATPALFEDHEIIREYERIFAQLIAAARSR
jgi:protein O-GlcNAc transferase